MKRHIAAACALATISVFAADEADTIRFGHNPGGTALLALAIDEGYFKDAGVDAIPVFGQSSSDGLAALQAGKLDVGATFGTSGPLTFRSKGAPFVIIGGNLLGGHPIIVQPEDADKYKSIEDFRGKKVATPRIFTSDIVFRGALVKAGLDLEKDLELVEFKRTIDVLAAIKSRKVDVAIGSSSIYARAIEQGLSIPLWSTNVFPDHPCCRIVATEKAIAEKRPALVNFLKGIIRADKKIHEDRESGAVAQSKVFELPLQTAHDQTFNPSIDWGSNPNRKGVERMWTWMKDIGYVENDIDLNQTVDTSLWRQALDELEKEFPGDPFWDVLEKRWLEQDAE